MVGGGHHNWRNCTKGLRTPALGDELQLAIIWEEEVSAHTFLFKCNDFYHQFLDQRKRCPSHGSEALVPLTPGGCAPAADTHSLRTLFSLHRNVRR